MRKQQRLWGNNPSFWTCFLMLNLLVSKGCSQQPQVRDDRGNLQFDPDHNNTKECSIPVYQDPLNDFQPLQGVCPTDDNAGGAWTNNNNNKVTLETIPKESLHALAVAYAPVIFFHPLEKYTMSSVEYSLSNPQGGRILRKTKQDSEAYVVQETLNATFLLETTRDPLWALNPGSFYFETERAYEMYESPPEARYGSGYDSVTGRSKAPLYYNVYDSGNNTWTFNYWIYYPFNGEGNIGILSTFEGKVSYTRFTLKPYGSHEGDWESINVMVCAPTTTAEPEVASINPPLAVKYHQHDWSQTKDCTQGQCNFFKDTYHPVGFSALNSHATYSESVGDLVYDQINIGFFYSLQSVTVVDRTVYKKEDGSYNYYFPDTNNLERFQDPYTIQVSNNDNDNDNNASSSQQYYWQGFGGRWGVGEKVEANPQPPLCLTPEQWGYQPCPTNEEDPVFDLVMQVLLVSPPKGELVDILRKASTAIVDMASWTGTAPFGPGTKGFWEKWIPVVNAPFWRNEPNISMTPEYFCQQTLHVEDTHRQPVNVDTVVNPWNQIIGIIITSVVITILNTAIPLAVLYFRKKPYQPILIDENGIPHNPSSRPFGNAPFMLGAIVFTLSFVVLLTAGFLFIVSLVDVFQKLDELIPNVAWGTIHQIIEALGIVIMAVNSITLIFLWMQAVEMKNMIDGTYEQLVVDRDSVGSSSAFLGEHHYVRWNPRVLEALFRISFALLFFSMLLSLLCVIIGFFTLGVSWVGVEACQAFAGTVDDYCLDLEIIGIDKIACGPDFQEVCNDFAKLNGQVLLWSAFFAFVSHFYLVAAAGYASQQRRSIPIILALYSPTRTFKSTKTEGQEEAQEALRVIKDGQTANCEQTSECSPEVPKMAEPLPVVRGSSLLSGDSLRENN